LKGDAGFKPTAFNSGDSSPALKDIKEVTEKQGNFSFSLSLNKSFRLLLRFVK
jgi:hypothetical protein